MRWTDFLWLGREQRHIQRMRLAALFVTLLGVLSVHARLRVCATLRVVERLPLPERAAFLELGFGYGYALFHLAQRRPSWSCLGIDQDFRQVTNGRVIADAEGLRNVRLEQVDLMVWGEADTGYHLIIAGDVLYSISEPDTMLRACRHWLAPGGWLVLHTPQPHHLHWRLWPTYHNHPHREGIITEFTPAELAAALSHAGLIVAHVEPTFGYWGEIAFELNQLGWRRPPLRAMLAVLTFPLAVALAYLDHRWPLGRGNGYVMAARRPDAPAKVFSIENSAIIGAGGVGCPTPCPRRGGCARARPST